MFAKCGALTLAFWLSFAAMQLRDTDMDKYSMDRYFLYNLATITGLLLASLREEGPRFGTIGQNDFLRAMREAFRDLMYVFAALAVNLVLTKDIAISRVFLVFFGVLLFGTLFLFHRRFSQLAARWFYGGAQRHNTLLVGPLKRARQLESWLRGVSRYGIHTSGLLTDAAGQDKINIPILGSPEDLPSILEMQSIQSVILLDTPSLERMLRFMEWTEAQGARLMVLNTLAEDLERPLQYYRHLGVDFITFREEPLQDPGNRFFKRCFDLILAGFAVAFVLPPLALAVWIAQRLQAPGPLFYRQARAGMRNHAFEIFKFRTMRVSNNDPAMQARAEDERIYRFGRFLRRTSLDEIPQFLNVLLGDMSAVGPRPHMLEHNTQFAKVFHSYHIRTFVRPGVTGLAQTRGFRGEARSTSDIQQRVQCDLEYIESWSLGLDLQIVLHTILQVVRPPKTAY